LTVNGICCEESYVINGFSWLNFQVHECLCWPSTGPLVCRVWQPSSSFWC
jgi:hypothetical protein